MWKPEKKQILFHPSYGYATPEQIEKLTTLNLHHPDREQALREIKIQNKNKGKM